MARRSAEDAASDAGADAPARSWRDTVGRLWWCILTGFLVFPAFPFRTVPGTNLWPLAWIALVPLLLAIENVKPRKALLLGWVAGTVTNFGGFWWIAGLLEEFGGLPSPVAWPLTVLNAAYQGLSFGLAAWLIAKLQPRDEDGGRGPRMSVFRVAAIFTVVEYLFPLIFPWYLANSQYRFLEAIQIAELVGVAGITFVIVAFNAAAYRVVRHLAFKEPPAWRQVVAAVVLAAVTLVYGAIRVGQVDDRMAAAETLKVGVVEADIGIMASERRANPDKDPRLLVYSHLLRYQRMSRQAAAQGVDLVVWPESSYFPVDYVYIKRSSDFAVGATRDGQLVAWRDMTDPATDAGERMQWVVLNQGGRGKLRDVAAVREDAMVAVGDGGLAVISDGRSVRELTTSTKEDLYAVDVATARGIRPRTDRSAIAVWAAGARGTLLRGDHVRLDRISSGVTTTLRAIHLTAGDSGAAVGDGGAFVAIAAGQARAVASGTQADLRGVWCDGPSSYCWAVGDGGAILRQGGREGVAPEASGTTATLRAVVGRAGGEVFAVGDGGTVLRRGSDGRWAREDGPRGELVAATFDARDEALLVSAKDGGLWRRGPQGGWKRQDAPGLGQVVGLAPLPYVRVYPKLPRDVRYIWQAKTPVPADEAFWADPMDEFRLPEAERSAVQRGFDAPVLYGGITAEIREPYDPQWPTKDWNTALMLDRRGRVVGTYDKVYRLVFGEYIPFGDEFPVFYEWIPNAGRFEAGNEVKVFEWEGRRIGVMICYEDILPKFNRRLADRDPEVVINVTNDAWFGKTSEPYLHLALAVFRTVENRKALVRSTNTGVSAIVDATGRIVQQTKIRDPETLIADVPLLPGKTVYGRIGDAFAYALMVWLGVIILLRLATTGGGPRAPGKRIPRPSSGPLPEDDEVAAAPKPRGKKKRKGNRRKKR